MPYPTFLPTVPDFLTSPQYGPFTESATGVRFLFGVDGASTLCVFRSADYGVTWTKADPATVKLCQSTVIACVKDAAYPVVPNIYVVWLDGVFPGPYTYTLSVFNTTTETWGADAPSLLAEDPSVSGVNIHYLVHRATDNKLILWTASVVELVGVNNRTRCQIAFYDLTLGVWSGYTQIGTPGGDDADYTTNGCVVGAGGITHLFLIQDNLPLFILLRTKNLIHVSLSAADVASANQVMQAFTPDDCAIPPLRGIDGTGTNGHVIPIARVAGANTEILYPYITETQPGGVGTDYIWNLNVAKALSAAVPAWVFNSIETTIRPFLEVAPNYYKGFGLVNDTGDILNAFWARTRRVIENDLINTSISADGLAWSVPALFYDIPSPIPGNTSFFGPMGIERVGSIGLFAEITDFLTGASTAYWDAPAAAPVALPSLDFFRRGKPQIRCANVWDWCLQNDERATWRAMDWRRRRGLPDAGCRSALEQCLREGKLAGGGFHLDLDNPLHALPDQGREFHKYGAIGLPVPNTDTRIFQFNVPTGYDGIVYAVLCKFVGLGFVDGSGDLMWRFQMNRHWIKSLSAIPTELGDYTAYAQIEEFVRIYSGQTIAAFGWLSPASALVPDPSRRMIAAMQGWYFPAGLME